MNQIQLDGKTAIVTGAAKGIGKSIVARLVESGAHVWMWDNDERSLVRAARDFGEDVRTLCLDVSSYEDVVAATQTVSREAGQIDILVNNA